MRKRIQSAWRSSRTCYCPLFWIGKYLHSRSATRRCVINCRKVSSPRVRKYPFPNPLSISSRCRWQDQVAARALAEHTNPRAGGTLAASSANGTHIQSTIASSPSDGLGSVLQLHRQRGLSAIGKGAANVAATEDATAAV